MLVRKTRHVLTTRLMRILSQFFETGRHSAFIGSGSSGQLCRHIQRSGAASILIVTDKPLRDLGVVDRATSALAAASGVELVIYDGVRPDPTYAQVREGATLFREHACDAVLAIGGGSSIDAAKIIAASATSDQSPRGWVGNMKITHELPPVYAIPTTSGTGSEATIGAVISDDVTHEKSVIVSTALLPTAVALDPDLILGLPAHITAATGMDALTHGIEAYIGSWDRGSRSQDARMAIKLIFDNLEAACTDGANVEAREAMSLASYYGGLAINLVNVGNVHAIAHQLGGIYGIPHGLANSLVLPHVLSYCENKSRERLAELAVLVGVSEPGEAVAHQSTRFIGAVRELAERVGMPVMSECLNPADFDRIIASAIAEGDSYHVPKLMSKDAVRNILNEISA